MPQIALINSETERAGLQYVGDLVGVYEDSHIFSPTELVKFTILTVGAGNTREEVEEVIDRIKPTMKIACLWPSDADHHWTKPPTRVITLSQGNPTVIQSTNHGYSTGMPVTVSFRFLSGVDYANIGGTISITAIDNNSFSIPLDTTTVPGTFVSGTVREVYSAIDVFQVEGSRRWYKMVNDFKFPVNLESLTPAEKQLLETVDVTHPSVDSFIRKIVKDITVLSENDVEVRELRNTSPPV